MSLETPFLRNVVATKTVVVIVTQMPITSASQQGSAAFNSSKPNILVKYMEITDTSTLRLLTLCLQLASCFYFLEDLNNNFALL